MWLSINFDLVREKNWFSLGQICWSAWYCPDLSRLVIEKMDVQNDNFSGKLLSQHTPAQNC